MKKIARNHHFVPQGYLGGFTDTGTRYGHLFVSDLVSNSVFRTKPRNVGAKRDFNRIDVDGQDPDALEKAFGEFEGRVIPVIREIQASGDLPTDDEFSYVLNLMALLVVRNPRSRKKMNDARNRTVRVIGDLLASDQRLYEHHIQKAKERGFVPSNAEVSFEAMNKFINEDQYTVTVTTDDSLSLELAGFENVLRLFGSRYWSLVTAAVNAPDFVTCDHPVTPIFKDSNRRGPIGYGLPHTEVSFPLNTRQALLGVLEDPLAPKIEAQASQVAAINSRTVCHASRQVYSKATTVTVLRSDEISTLN